MPTTLLPPPSSATGRPSADARRRVRAARIGVLLGLTMLANACGSDPPLAFGAAKVKVGYDASEVMDAAILDTDRDGDADILVSTVDDVRLLNHDRGRWTDATPGSGLQSVAPLLYLHDAGEGDFVLERSTGLSRLVYSGIGSWTEEPGPVPDDAPAPALEVLVDLDGDGRPDRARIDGRVVVIELRGPDGELVDVTTRVGADGLFLPAAPRRLAAGDLDGDGDVDLLVVASRIFVLVNNGGVLDRVTSASMVPAIGAAGEDARSPASPPAPRAPGATAAPGASRAPGAPTAPTAPGTRTDRAWFADATTRSGLDFVHEEGDEQWDIRPTMGPGAAFDDVDADGDPDLYVVGGTGQSGRLFSNDGTGRFDDVTDDWGLLRDDGAGMGCLFADLDDDGDSDLYVTHDGPNVLWRHDGSRFTDVTAASGTGDGRWGASAACADVDNDGDLELFVTNYLSFDTSLLPDEPAVPQREDPLAMLPYVFPGQANVLYRNDGGLAFTDVTESAGLQHPDGKSLGAVFLDHDGDGWQDLYVANDTTPNTFWHNTGGGVFEETALFLGLDDPRGGMGLDAGDVDGDGDEDLLLTNWQLEPNALYRNNHVHGSTSRRFVPHFEDLAVSAGLARHSVGYVGWGCVLADLDNDGDRDLYVADGYTSPDYETTMKCVGQVDQLYENATAPGAPATHKDVPVFVLVEGDRAGAALELIHSSRGLATADVDGDGDLDLAVTANNGPLVLLENRTGGAGLRVVTEGNVTTCNRDAVGARVTLLLDDGTHPMAVARRGSSYLSGHERGVHFGLGDRHPVELVVAWPDGTTSRHPAAASGVQHIVQPDA